MEHVQVRHRASVHDAYAVLATCLTIALAAVVAYKYTIGLAMNAEPAVFVLLQCHEWSQHNNLISLQLQQEHQQHGQSNLAAGLACAAVAQRAACWESNDMQSAW